ncbi:response regulator [Dactylosporangium sp. CA-152071]|uniref:response regulator transcription factor n=1 Tax=Dactylosporangium sp. CA-152071 TaxID=3239933 RepID=UPI003D8CC8C9
MPVETTTTVGYRLLFQHAPAALLVLDPQLTIVDASDAYLAATMRTRHGLIGRHVFEAFPVNPDDPDAPGVASLEASLRRVLREQTTDVMAIHQYDIPRVGGGFEKRFWAPVSVPVCDEDGRLRWIVHRVDDVTAYVESQPDGLRFAQLAEQLRSSDRRQRARRAGHHLHRPPADPSAAAVGDLRELRAAMATVLIAEDVEDLTYALTRLLTRAGFTVRTAPDGARTLAEVRAELPDLLLLDLVMPRLNGLDVCRALRADPATAGVPILMLSAYAMPADLQAGLDAGADDYMMKPFQSDELIARCTALIK